MSTSADPRYDEPVPRALPIDAISLASLVVLATVLAIVLITTIESPLKDDIAWLVHVAKDVLHGKSLYVDDIEINPPLVIWLLIAPAAIAKWTGISANVLVVLLSTAVILLCAFWSAHLLRGYRPFLAKRIPVFAAVAVVLLIVPGVEFGQREHLLSACALPYLCILARRLGDQHPSPGQSLSSGAVAALGCALKPDYVLAFAAVEGIAIVRGLPMLRKESACFALLLLGYAGAVWFFYPPYLHVMVPLARDLYAASDASLGRLLIECHTLILGVAVAALLAITRSARRDPLFLVLATFGGGAALACFVEAKDWFYHRLPATFVILLALTYWIAGTMCDRTIADWRKLGAVMVSVFALGAFGGAAADRLGPRLEIVLQDRTALETRIERLLERHHIKSYLALSQSLSLGFPVVNDTGVAWASRFDSMWALRGELWRQNTRRPASEWPVTRWIEADFLKTCPDVVAVDDRDGIDYIRVLSASPGFAAAWSNYRQLWAFDGIRVFKLAGGNNEAAGAGPSAPVLSRAVTKRPSPESAYSRCESAHE